MGRIEQLMQSRDNFYSILKDPAGAAKEKAAETAKEAGSKFAEGIIDHVCNTFSHWFVEIMDLVAYKSVMFGILLYIMGVKKGGQFSWGIFAVWICLKVTFSLSL